MLNSPLQLALKESHYPEPTQQDTKTHKPTQHGISSSHSLGLLGIPSETLTGITSYLDPPSLFSLSRVNSSLYHHVGQDNTWRRAFASRYLGIGPENDLRDNVSYSVLFRRSETTWKKEFISRFKLERKWEYSRSSSISHSPVPSAISHIHLMSCQVVLSSCLKYGIVARSLPLNGKVYSGYLSAAANGIGIGGIGNPNMEFAPNASTCAIASRGGSATLLWGFLDGSVAVVSADKVMNPRRITAQLSRCSVHEEHVGSVSDAAWDDVDDGAEVVRAVTGGMDGHVKLWCNSESFECVWASDQHDQALFTDPCIKVAINKGSIAAAFQSGNICLWTGGPFGQQRHRQDIVAAQVKKISIPCPLLQEPRQDDENDGVLPSVASLQIDASNEEITLLVAYNDHPLFYRIKVAGVTTTTNAFSIETTAFGDPSFGPISCVSPYFAPRPDMGSFIIAGDYLGCISIYDWRSAASSHPLKPIRKFEAHEDGAAVTAIAWNGITLMTGSSRGAIHVWDGLTFIHLRSFAAHPSRRHRAHLLPGDDDVDDETIKQIVIDASKEMFVTCAGDRVLAWKADPLPCASSGKHWRSAANHVARKNKSSYAKYLEQLEMRETIKESRQMVEQENETFKRVVNREKEHRTKLDNLGLTEAEAVEYVMMLSLDEAAAERRSPNGSVENMFHIDEALEGEGYSSSTSYQSPPSPASVSTASDLTWSSSALSYVGSPTSLHSSSSRYEESGQASRNAVSVPELQTSPSASSVSSSASSLLSAASPSFGITATQSQPTSVVINEAHFPPISVAGSGASPPGTRSVSVRGKMTSTSSTSPVNQGKVVTTAASGGNNDIPKPKKSWSNVARSSSSSPAAPAPHPSCPLPSGRASSSSRRFQPVGGGGGVRYTTSTNDDAEMDEDLKYALELSLAEAQSKGGII